MERPMLHLLSWACCLTLLIPCTIAAAQEKATLPPIEFPAGTPTEEDYWRGWIDFHVANLTQNYDKFSAASAEAKQQVPDYFRGVVEMLATSRREMDLSADALAELIKQGEELAQLHDSDPLVQYCQGAVLFQAGKLTEAQPKLDEAMKNIEASKYPRWLIYPIVYERHRLILRIGSYTVLTPSQQKLAEHLPAWLARAADEPQARRYLWDLFEESFDHYAYDPQGKQQALLEAFAKQDKKDPWLWEMAQGVANIEAAWRFRGSGYANTVTPEGWEKFGEQMQQADKHLRKAYEIAPEFPEAATSLVTVSMTGFDAESISDWFQRAIAGQCDYMPAYDGFMWSLRPRWGGSHEQMLEFAEQCVRTRRFDTRIPYFYFTASNDVRLELDAGWSTYVEDPQIYRRLTYVLKQLADDPSRAGANGKLSKQQAYYLTQQLVLALHAEKHEDAIKLVKQLGNDVHPRVFERMQSSYPFGVARMYAYHQFDGDLAKLRPLAELPRNDPEKARQWLAGVQSIAKRNREPAAQPYFDDVLRRAQMEVDFHDGKWVNLTFDPALSDWDKTPGQWTYESEKSVIASSVGTDFGFRCFHYCQFAGPREIMCDIDVIESYVPYLFLGIYHGNFRDVGAMFWIEQARKQLGAAKWGADKLPYLAIDVPKLEHLHVRVWGADRVELYGNGSWQSFINKGEEYTNDPEQFALNRVGFGAMWCRTSTSIVRFSNVRVHKLGPPPPEWNTDANNDTTAEIIAYYDRELESNPDFAYAYFYRGLAKGNAKQYAAAIPDYERGLELVPSALGFRGMLGSALCQTGKYREGIEQLERAYAEGLPKRAPMADTLAAYAAYFLATAPDDKVRNGDRALELATKSCAATKREKFYPLLALAVAQAEKGQFDAALATIDEASPLVKGEKPKAALARCHQSLVEKKPWRYNVEKADEDIYWIGNE